MEFQEGWVSRSLFMTSAKASAWDPPALISQKYFSEMSLERDNYFMKWQLLKWLKPIIISERSRLVLQTHTMKPILVNLSRLVLRVCVCVYIQGCSDPIFPVTGKRAFVISESYYGNIAYLLDIIPFNFFWRLSTTKRTLCSKRMLRLYLSRLFTLIDLF